MPTPTTQSSTPPQSGRIGQQASPSTVVLQGYEAGAFPTVAFVNQLAVDLTQRALVYFTADGTWQGVASGGEVQSFYGEVAPTGVGQAGDRWFNTKSLMWYSWNPTYTAWMAGDLAYGEVAPTNPTVGQAWFNASTRALTYFNGTTWVAGTDPTAPGVYSGAMPAAATAGSAWTDTDGVVWGCDVTYTGSTGAGKWSRWSYRVDPLAKLILANGSATMAGEATSSPPTPAIAWSSVTLGMVWLDSQAGANLGKFFVWDGTAWRQVYAPNTIDLCLSLIAGSGEVEFNNTDSARATGTGDVNITLTHIPKVGSEQVYVGGLPIPSSVWSRTKTVLTIPGQPWFWSGMGAWVDYAYDANKKLRPLTSLTLRGYTDDGSLPAATQLGDFLVVVTRGRDYSGDSRLQQVSTNPPMETKTWIGNALSLAALSFTGTGVVRIAAFAGAASKLNSSYANGTAGAGSPTAAAVNGQAAILALGERSSVVSGTWYPPTPWVPVNNTIVPPYSDGGVHSGAVDIFYWSNSAASASPAGAIQTFGGVDQSDVVVVSLQEG